MCGIIGCIGISRNPELSFKILSSLLEMNQRRGYHSTGHFLVDINNDTSYFKSPLPSSVYVQTKEWKSIEQIKFKTLIAHSRWKSQGGELDNSNNHPHVSKTGNIGLIHNGTIAKYKDLSIDYTLDSNCDSELLLKIILKENNVIKGIKKIYELIGKTGNFACCAIYRNPDNGKARFFFFRDPGRPGRFIDAIKITGQYFFCSTNEIWYDAIKNIIKENSNYKELEDIKPVLISPFKIWEIDSEELIIKKHEMLHQIRIRNRKKKKNDKPEFKKITDNYGITITGKGYISKYEYATPYLYD